MGRVIATYGSLSGLEGTRGSGAGTSLSTRFELEGARVKRLNGVNVSVSV